jgi:Tfp pilus assembly protein PilX
VVAIGGAMLMLILGILPMESVGSVLSNNAPWTIAAMFIIVVLLLTLGVMTLTGFYLARGQFRLTANIQHLDRAFNQTEAVAANAESWLNTGSNAKLPAFDTRDPAMPELYPSGELAALSLDPRTMAWDSSNSVDAGDGRYLVEQLIQNHKPQGSSLNMAQKSGPCSSVDLFRVIARSESVRGSMRLIETTQATDGC